MTNNASIKIIVGLSGGVDSSVTAMLLQQQGYHVEAVFMKNWEADDDDDFCTAAQDLADAQSICARLNIPLHSINFAKEYWDRVFTHFLAEYRAGRTPNPDILCNKEIKFRAFLDFAIAQGADYIATGHYVRKRQIGNTYQLLKGCDPNKDQSYFLYTLSQEQLARSLFPIGEINKNEVREMAQSADLITHNKKDSTGICFIGERKFKSFLSEYILAQPGEMRTPEGTIIGRHEGLMYYTIGQRQGLQIGGVKDAPDAPWYVLQKDVPNNILIVGQGSQHPLLFASGLVCGNIDWVSGKMPHNNFSCAAKTRYRQADQNCNVVILENGKWEVNFDEPQRAITPGQAIVFYDGEICLGGGTIEGIV